MSDRGGRGLLKKLRGEEGFTLIEAALIGLVAGTAFVGTVYWGVTQTADDRPPPNLGVSAPAPLAPPPDSRDQQCVQLAYETNGLIYNAAGDPAKFEGPQNGMWFIAGIVSGPGSVYTPREVEAKVKHRYFLAQRRWTSECQETTRSDLPEQPSPPTDPRQLYYGTYRLTWINKMGPTCGPAPELKNLPTTLTAGSPGESRSGVIITLGVIPPTEASFGGDRFNTPGEDQGAGIVAQLSGTFVERSGRIEIESGRYEFFQGTGSSALCTISYTGIK